MLGSSQMEDEPDRHTGGTGSTNSGPGGDRPGGVGHTFGSRRPLHHRQAAGIDVVFLARHGRGHKCRPAE